MQEDYEVINMSLSLITQGKQVLSVRCAYVHHLYLLPQFNGGGISKCNVSMAMKHCPPGYVLQSTPYTSSDFGLSCTCDTVTDANIVNCEPGLDSVLLKVCDYHLIII